MNLKLYTKHLVLSITFIIFLVFLVSFFIFLIILTFELDLFEGFQFPCKRTNRSQRVNRPKSTLSNEETLAEKDFSNHEKIIPKEHHICRLLTEQEPLKRNSTSKE